MKKKYQRLMVFFLIASIMIIAFFWILDAFRMSLIYYVNPSELAQIHIQKTIRVGGTVVIDSWDKTHKTFFLQDQKQRILVVYKQPLPELFRENQEAVAEGIYDGKTLFAHKVFAKHDENYLPQETVNKLKAIGQWRGPK